MLLHVYTNLKKKESAWSWLFDHGVIALVLVPSKSISQNRVADIFCMPLKTLEIKMYSITNKSVLYKLQLIFLSFLFRTYTTIVGQ